MVRKVAWRCTNHALEELSFSWNGEGMVVQNRTQMSGLNAFGGKHRGGDLMVLVPATNCRWPSCQHVPHPSTPCNTTNTTKSDKHMVSKPPSPPTTYSIMGTKGSTPQFSNNPTVLPMGVLHCPVRSEMECVAPSSCMHHLAADLSSKPL